MGRRLLVTGGLLVDEDHVRRADLLIEDGRVAAVLEPGHGAVAEATLEATGRHVLPGLVDAHVHFNEPGRTDWEGFATGTRAAAAGGVTTVVDMPLNSHPPTLDGRALALKRAAVADHAAVDYALWGGVVPGSLDHLPALRDGGVVGVKAFLCDSGLPDYPSLDQVDVLDSTQRTAELDLLLALHAEDAAVTSRLGREARAAGRREPIDWARSRPPAAEVRAVEQTLEGARQPSPVSSPSGRGTPRLHFVHISTPRGVQRIADARRDGMDVTVETCPHYLCLDESDLERLGAVAKCAPPLRSRDVVDGLWDALLSGAIDWVASDHSPCPPRLKEGDVWQAWGGISGVQTMLPLLLHEGVHRRGLQLPRLVSLTSANPARRLGLYPTKGALRPGSDADLALVDLDAEWTLQSADLKTRWPTSPFVGRTLRGRVVDTLVRGEPPRDGVGRFVRP